MSLSSKQADLLLVFSVVILNLLSILPMLAADAATVDLGETIYNSRQILSGKVPYLEIVSHHFMGYLFLFVLLSFFMNLTPAVLWGVCILFNLLNALLIFKTVMLIADRRAAIVGALITVTLGWFWGWHGMTFNLQSYLLPFLNATIYLLVRACQFSSRKSISAAAFLLGLLLLMDQRIVVFTPLLLVPLFGGLGIWQIGRKLLALTPFFLLPMTCLILLWQLGAMQEFFEQTILAPLYARNCRNPYTAEMLSNLFSWGIASERSAVILSSIGLVLIAIYEQRSWIKALVFIGTLSALIYTALGGRDYPNYLLLLAPTSLLSIALLDRIIRVRFEILAQLFSLVLGLLILNASSISLKYYLQHGRFTYPFDNRAIKESAQFLNARLKPEEKILVWGYAPSIYNLTGTFSPFRDVGLGSVTGTNFFSYDSKDQCYDQKMVDELKLLLNNEPPTFFVRVESTGKKCEEVMEICPPAYTDFSRTFALLNYDYERVSHLRFIKERIGASYKLETSFETALEKVTIFKLIISN